MPVSYKEGLDLIDEGRQHGLNDEQIAELKNLWMKRTGPGAAPPRVPPALDPQNPETPGALDQIGTSIANAAKGAVSVPPPSVAGALAPGGPKALEMARGIWDAQAAQGRDAAREYQAGNYANAARHGVAAAVPVLGPAIEDTASKATTQGRPWEAATDAALGLLGPKLAGGAARLIGRGLQGTAVPLAESALGIRPIDRAYGKTPGAAMLAETSGITPAGVKAGARASLDDLNAALDAHVSRSQASASLQPAVTVIDKAINTAKGRNASGLASQLESLRTQLTTNADTGLPLSPTQTPAGLLELKRGFASENISNWKPDSMKGVKAVAARAYKALDQELDRTVPEAASINQKISSLIPVESRAGVVTQNAPLGQKVMGRFAAHTGALATGVLGYERMGLPGFAAGVLLPEMLASPATQLGAARALYGAGGLLRQAPYLPPGGGLFPLLGNEPQDTDQPPLN